MNQKQLLSDVSSRYGAPMGRRTISDSPESAVNLFRVKFVAGDYDVGGAYWGGGGKPLYAAIGDDFQTFTRANSRKEAGEIILARFPALRLKRKL